MRRIVIDTNILIAYLRSRGAKTTQLMRQIEDQTLIPIFSEAMLTELINMAERQQFRDKIAPEALSALLDFLEAAGEMVGVPAGMPPFCADPKDDMFLHAAIVGKAELVVSGDQHLLDAPKVEGVRVVLLREVVLGTK